MNGDRGPSLIVKVLEKDGGAAARGLIMATILEFRSATRKGVASVPRGKSADILLFTGVRYQRWQETIADPERQDRRGRDGRQLDD